MRQAGHTPGVGSGHRRRRPAWPRGRTISHCDIDRQRTAVAVAPLVPTFLGRLAEQSQRDRLHKRIKVNSLCESIEYPVSARTCSLDLDEIVKFSKRVLTRAT